MQKTVLIIGASRGIGLCLAQEYNQKGYRVISTCRSSNPELQKFSHHVITNIDLLQQNTPQILSENLSQNNFKQIDTVIYNAGVLNHNLNALSIGQMQLEDIQGFQNEMYINAIAPMFVMNALLSGNYQIKKLAVVSSQMGCINEAGGKYYAYRMSKAAINMGFKSMSSDLKDKGVLVAILHPGFVETDMTATFNAPGKITPQQSAEGMFERIEKDLNEMNSGTFWNRKGEILGW